MKNPFLTGDLAGVKRMAVKERREGEGVLLPCANFTGGWGMGDSGSFDWQAAPDSQSTA